MMTRMNFRFLIFAVCLFLFSCSAKSDRGQMLARLMVLVEDEKGEPLSGAIIEARAEALTRRPSDELGQARFHLLPSEEGIHVHADCPVGYQGPSLERRIGKGLLDSARDTQWTLTLRCLNRQSSVVVAALVEGCDAFELWLDGHLLGEGKEGVFHGLTDLVTGKRVVLTIRDPSEECQPSPSERSFIVGDSPLVAFRFEGGISQGTQKGRVRSRSQPRKPASRPYRL